MKFVAHVVLMALLLAATGPALSTPDPSKDDFARMKTQPGAVMLSPTDPAVIDLRRRSRSGAQKAYGSLQGHRCAAGDTLRIQEEAVCEPMQHDGKDGRLCCAANCNYACGGGRLQGRCSVRSGDCAFVPARR